MLIMLFLKKENEAILVALNIFLLYFVREFPIAWVLFCLFRRHEGLEAQELNLKNLWKECRGCSYRGGWGGVSHTGFSDNKG